LDIKGSGGCGLVQIGAGRTLFVADQPQFCRFLYKKNRAKAIKELRAAEKSLWLKRFVTT